MSTNSSSPFSYSYSTNSQRTPSSSSYYLHSVLPSSWPPHRIPICHLLFRCLDPLKSPVEQTTVENNTPQPHNPHSHFPDPQPSMKSQVASHRHCDPSLTLRHLPIASPNPRRLHHRRLYSNHPPPRSCHRPALPATLLQLASGEHHRHTFPAKRPPSARK